MASVTMEKALFIMFGLIVFSIISVPLYDSINQLIDQNEKKEIFEENNRKIEAGIRIVEKNNSKLFYCDLLLNDNYNFSLEENNWKLKIEFSSKDILLSNYVYGQCFPFKLILDKCSGVMNLEIKSYNGFIQISIRIPN